MAVAGREGHAASTPGNQETRLVASSRLRLAALDLALPKLAQSPGGSGGSMILASILPLNAEQRRRDPRLTADFEQLDNENWGPQPPRWDPPRLPRAPHRLRREDRLATARRTEKSPGRLTSCNRGMSNPSKALVSWKLACRAPVSGCTWIVAWRLAPSSRRAGSCSAHSVEISRLIVVRDGGEALRHRWVP